LNILSPKVRKQKVVKTIDLLSYNECATLSHERRGLTYTEADTIGEVLNHQRKVRAIFQFLKYISLSEC